MITKTIGGVSFDLQEDFDFEFLSDYGRVFKVYDQQDSGNLCFGVQSAERKRFVKLAGASTMRSNTSPDEVVSRMKGTISIYEDLSHPTLIQLIEHKEVNGGYITVFDWFEGDCMGRQYESYARFETLPLTEKLNIFHEIVLFHIHVHSRGYIAIDFYDGCILYDFERKQMMLCDIEFYSKNKPIINTMGRMWGSSRYMSPEEFQKGAVIDERSNVYLMGATAFQLFGGGTDRSREAWRAGDELYPIAWKAVQAKKEERYSSINEFHSAWTDALAR